MANGAVPALPGWVVPARSEVSDLEWLAYRLWQCDGAGEVAAGVNATAQWVAGGGSGRSPATGVVAQPVTEEMARAEMDAALRAYHAASRATDREYLARWAVGIWRTLGWLLGLPDMHVPYVIPRRHPEPDWRTLSAQELYDQAMRADPQRYAGQAQRSALRQRCERDARCYAQVAVLIDDTLRQVAALAADTTAGAEV